MTHSSSQKAPVILQGCQAPASRTHQLVHTPAARRPQACRQWPWGAKLQLANKRTCRPALTSPQEGSFRSEEPSKRRRTDPLIYTQWVYRKSSRHSKLKVPGSHLTTLHSADRRLPHCPECYTAVLRRSGSHALSRKVLQSSSTKSQSALTHGRVHTTR